MLDENQLLFTVTDLKQYHYCARIAYYHLCLPHIRPVTYKMEAGIKRHEDERKRSLRRNMNLPHIDQAERLFDVSVQSAELGLSGQVDEVLIFEDEAIVVDYKLAKKVGMHFKVQLAAYAMMVETSLQMPVRHGVIYLIRSRQSVEVAITQTLRHKVVSALQDMRQIAALETMPPPTPNRRSCVDCEFHRFCNDV